MNKNSVADFEKSNVRADIEYYAIFCTYRRRKVFYENNIICRFTELANMYMKEMECDILSMTVKEDHIILGIKANALLSPMSIIFTLRHNTSSVLRHEFEFLNKTTALWNRGLLLSTKEITEDVYHQFLEEQKRKGVRGRL